MNTFQFTSKSDIIGAMASSLCLIHCLATPLLFVTQAGILGIGDSYLEWWGIIDVIFLIVSFIAIWWSSKNTSKRWVRFALWVSWLLLALVIINEKLSLFPLFEEAIYVPSISLVFLHLYNRKYCRCKEGECYVHS
jgi:hypothetical protein